MTDYHENEILTPAAPDQPETTEGRLAVRLRDISHTLRALNEGRGSQRRILAILLEAGTMTQRELTERLDIRSGSASEVIAKLEDTGLITRTPSEEDRRTADIALTEAGRQQAEAAGASSRYTEMFSALTGEEQEQLLGLLEKLGTDWGERYPTGHDRRREGRGKGCGEDRRRGKHGEGHHHDMHEGCCRGEHEGSPCRERHGEDHYHERHEGGRSHERHGEDRHHGEGEEDRHGERRGDGHHGEDRREMRGPRQEMHGDGPRRHEGREEGYRGKGCDHDCEHCAHPCGKGRARRGD